MAERILNNSILAMMRTKRRVEKANAEWARRYDQLRRAAEMALFHKLETITLKEAQEILDEHLQVLAENDDTVER